VTQTDSASEQFGAYLVKEMEELTPDEREDFKCEIMMLLRNIKKARKSPVVIEILDSPSATSHASKTIKYFGDSD